MVAQKIDVEDVVSILARVCPSSEDEVVGSFFMAPESMAAIVSRDGSMACLGILAKGQLTACPPLCRQLGRPS
jgi:hypothetical protein